MASLDTNGCKTWPLDGAQKAEKLIKMHFWAPSSGQVLQPLVSRDAKFYGVSNEYLFVTQKCTQPC